MHIMLIYKQNFFIYIISLNPFNNPIFKTKKLIIRIRETVSGHTSEFDDAKSQKWGPQTLKPLILYHSLRTWLLGSSNTLDQALRGGLTSEPFCIFHVSRWVTLSSWLSLFFSMQKCKIKN